MLGSCDVIADFRRGGGMMAGYAHDKRLAKVAKNMMADPAFGCWICESVERSRGRNCRPGF